MTRDESIVISGFGGQGILLMSQLLCRAAMDEGLHVTWMPSYGPEMRGGTAKCTVMIAPERIGSPITLRPSSLIAMNEPALTKFAGSVKPGGTVVVNTSLAAVGSDLGHVRVVKVMASTIADRIGNQQVSNMAALGAYVQASAVVKLATVVAALSRVIPAHAGELLRANEAALRQGAAAALAMP